MTRRTERGVTFEDVRRMMLAMPGVEARSSYGTPGFHVAKKFMSRLREEDVLVLTGVEDVEKQFLMDTDPEAFFTTDHYRGHPTILIRLSKVDRVQLGELIQQSWRRRAPAKLVAECDGPRPRPAQTQKGSRRGD